MWLFKRKWNIGYVFAIFWFLNVGKKFSLIYLNSVLFILINKVKTLKKRVKHLQKARSSMQATSLQPLTQEDANSLKPFGVLAPIPPESLSWSPSNLSSGDFSSLSPKQQHLCWWQPVAEMTCFLCVPYSSHNNLRWEETNLKTTKPTHKKTKNLFVYDNERIKGKIPWGFWLFSWPSGKIQTIPRGRDVWLCWEGRLQWTILKGLWRTASGSPFGSWWFGDEWMWTFCWKTALLSP